MLLSGNCLSLGVSSMGWTQSSAGAAPDTLKVYVVATAAEHAPVEDVPVG